MGITPGYVVLSVKFDRGFTIARSAQFVQQLLGGRAKCYSPNWFNKSDCGNAQCKGCTRLCRKAILGPDDRPTNESCWRFSYRWHLQRQSGNGNPTVMLRICSGGSYGSGQL